MIDFLRVDCPYCGEHFESAFDTSAGDCVMTEDCTVCCRPILMHLAVDDEGDAHVRCRREQD